MNHSGAKGKMFYEIEKKTTAWAKFEFFFCQGTPLASTRSSTLRYAYKEVNTCDFTVHYEKKYTKSLFFGFN